MNSLRPLYISAARTIVLLAYLAYLLPRWYHALQVGHAAPRAYGQLVLAGLVPLVSLAFTLYEYRRYRAWQRGQVNVTDMLEAMSNVSPSYNLFSFRQLLEETRASYYEVRVRQRRAARRWPRRQRDLVTLLRRPWTRGEWKAVGIVVGGQLLILALSWLGASYLSPGNSLLVSLLAMGVANLLLLLGWLAGDDDEGGARPPRPKPVPLTGQGVKPTLRVQTSPTRVAAQPDRNL